MKPLQIPELLPGAIYARISYDRKGEETGVGRQVELSEPFASRRGVSVPEDRIFVDNNIPAMKPGMPRPAFDRMIELVRAGEVKVIVVYQTMRLWRDRAERFWLFELLTDLQVDVFCVRDNDLDFSTAGGRLTAGIHGEVNAWEVEVRRERQIDELVQRASHGLPPICPRCFGYTEDGWHLVPEEAEAVADVFRLFIAGETIRGLARELNRRELVTSRGAPFSDSTVRAMLLKARYAGLRELYGELHHGRWPAIVSEAQWRAAVAIIKDPDRRTAHRYERTRLGSGLYRCGPCATSGVETTVGPCKRHGKPGYRCGVSGHLARVGGPIDLVVEGAVIARLSRPDAVDLLVDHAAPDLEKLQSEANALRVRLDEIAAMLGDGLLTRAQFQRANEKAQGALERVVGQMQDAQRAPVLGDLIGVRDVAGAWVDLSLGRKRAVVDTLMTVTVLSANRSRVFNPETVRIDWR